MLKGLLIASSGAGLLEEELDRNHFPWAEVPKKDGEAFRDAAAFREAALRLSERADELLCLVETDREEETARSLGLICVGYVNPSLKEQRLSGCRILLEGFQEIDLPFLRNVHTRALGLPVLTSPDFGFQEIKRLQACPTATPQ